MGIIHKRHSAIVVAAVVLMVTSVVVTASVRAVQDTKVNPDAAAIAEFTKRVNAYAELHKKVESMLKEPSQDGRPEAVVEHQREFARLMQKERPHAKPGDI